MIYKQVCAGQKAGTHGCLKLLLSGKSVCVHVCTPPRLLVTSDMIWTLMIA